MPTLPNPHPWRRRVPDASLFREYDIRGIVGETLFPADAFAIGRAFAQRAGVGLSRAPIICVGWDGRISSVEMETALTAGLQAGGAEVTRIGLGPTPMLYFSVYHLKTDGGVMVTGSHNPPSHNGFKFMLGEKPFYGADIQALRGAIEGAGNFTAAIDTPTPHPQSHNIQPAYLEILANSYAANHTLSAAWDAGNGATGAIMAALCARLPGRHIPLFAEIDGTFPNHHPDPTVPNNLESLIKTVRTQGLDVGVAFDGDGDRIGVVDDTGEILWGDQILAILAADVLSRKPGATIIADVKASQALFNEINLLGGIPLMWKTGHSLVKAKMKETGAPLAGEMSGHIFIADGYYGYDDGLYAAIRLLNVLAASGKKLSELRLALPQTVSTPEIRFACDETRKFAVIEEVTARLRARGAAFSDIDGVRVQTPDGWWLLRASNTQAVLVARCESSTAEGLERLQNALRAALAESSVELP